MEKLAAGTLVKHRTLGAGKVVAVEATALHVFFPGSGTRHAAKLRWPVASPFLTQDGLEPDAWLEGLSSFALDSASGRYTLAANFMSHEAAVAAYLADHPAAFKTSPPEKNGSRLERGARWRAACAEWTAALGGEKADKLLEEGNDAELIRRLLRVAAHAARIPGMVETDVLKEALEPREVVRDFLDALFGYVAAPLPTRARFEKLLEASHALGALPDAAWPMVTFFPFVAAPSRHMVLLPRSTSAGASCLGCDLQYQAAPSWATYVRLRELSTRLLERLATVGARDFVDVECFLHATGGRRQSVSPTGAVPSTKSGRRAVPRRKP